VRFLKVRLSPVVRGGLPAYQQAGSSKPNFSPHLKPSLPAFGGFWKKFTKPKNPPLERDL